MMSGNFFGKFRQKCQRKTKGVTAGNESSGRKGKEKNRMILPVDLGKNSYDITLERGALDRAEEIFDLDRKVLIVTDSGVPEEYSQKLAKACKESYILTIPQGEESKNLDTFQKVCKALLEHSFTRKDCAVAVGGGVVGDLTGFATACYMRGIDFYNVPTTLLSQVDSSVGGKTAVDFNGIKNIIGAFYQPKGVLIDPDVLKTLNQRQFACGAAEIIKMAVSLNGNFFEKLEKESVAQDLINNIAEALKIKIDVVQKDEKEQGLRRALNFGHTLGHGIESCTELYHGECVALGMLTMCSSEIRERLIPVLIRENLPVACPSSVSAEVVVEAAMHDKKAAGDHIAAIYVAKAGNFQIVKEDRNGLLEALKEVLA